MPAVLFHGLGRDAKHEYRAALGEDLRHRLPGRVRVFDRAAAGGVRVHHHVALTLEMCGDDPPAVEGRRASALRRWRERLEEIRVERINREVCDARRVQQFLARLPDLCETIDVCRLTGQAAADVEQHLSPAWHVTHGLRYPCDRVELADTAGTNTALAFPVVVGESHKGTIDRLTEQSLVRGEVLGCADLRKDHRREVPRA